MKMNRFLFLMKRLMASLEIKPAFRMREQEVVCKINAGKLFCEQNNFEFLYIDENYLAINSISLDELSILPQVEIIKKI